MKKNALLTIFTALFLLFGCDKESPELVPCMCDGSESTLGVFDCMCEPFKKKVVRRISYIRDEKPMQTVYITDEQRDAYLYLHQRRDQFAPVKLEYVDFRIRKGRQYDEYSNKLGNYRFRIFGCRREAKNVFLNQGRAMQKDMHFFDIFYEQMNDYYPVVVEKTNPYYLDSDRIENPEYLLTAEITDYFMNICDEFDWDEVKNKKLRSGSSEMTVTWRVMDLGKNNVYCKGTTTGYGQIAEGEPNGETLLVERAFEDALNKVPEIECFNRTLAQRVPSEEIARQLAYLRGFQTPVEDQYSKEIKGVELLQECASGLAPQGDTLVLADGIAETSGTAGNGLRSSAIVLTDAIEESSGASGSGMATRVRDNRTAGLKIDERCRAIEISDENCTVVKNTGDNVTIADDYWIDVPANTNDKLILDSRRMAENSFADGVNRFCIRNQPPYADLNPYNLYKIRASIVSVDNQNGKKGAGLILSDNLILTSADLIVKEHNLFDIQTINGKRFTASALRVNPSKNVALLLLSQPTQYTPLPLSLDLPEVNKDVLMSLGLLDLDTEGEGYIDNQGRVIGYRWSEERGSEIMVDTFVQAVTIGSTLIDKNGNIVGIAHDSRKTTDGPDLYLPVETALKGLGLEICGRAFPVRAKKPVAVKTYVTPLADAIDNSAGPKAPKPMTGLESK